MDRFNKKNRKLAEKLVVSEQYRKKVEETLINLPVENSVVHKKRHFCIKRIIQTAVCLFVIVCISLVAISSTNANVFTTFKKTIVGFFDNGEENQSQKLGVKSQQNYSQGRPGLLFELCESVIDRSNIYLLVKLTVSAEVGLDSQTGFEYLAFSYGDSFNTDMLLGGNTDCVLYEASEEENTATYIVSLSCVEEIDEGEQISVCFQNFMRNPYGENSEMLVEGVWNLSFTADYTVTDRLSVEGDEKLTYIFLGDEAVVRNLVLTPLGMEFSSWITPTACEQSAVSDSRLDIRLKLLDGSEIQLMSHDLEEPTPQVSGSSLLCSEDMETPCLTYQFEFENVLDLKQVLGVYVEDLFISVKNTD